MDKPRGPGPVYRFGPDRRVTALTAAGGFVAIVVAVFTADAGARVLAALAAVVLFAYAVSDLLFWPRLTLSADGVQVHGPFDRAALGWDAVDAVRADVRVRHGLRSVALEIDSGDSLVVLSRRALGADPAEVAKLADVARGVPGGSERRRPDDDEQPDGAGQR